MHYLNELNPAQLDAVQHTEGPLLVIAAAGTGKTKMLTHRIAHIIELGKADPHEILAVTFTNKAAREMQERIAGITNPLGLHLGTFHSIGARVLRQYAQIFDLSPSFTIINADDQLKLIKNLLAERGIDTKTYDPKMILGIISRWKDIGLRSGKISDEDAGSRARSIARDIYNQYQSRLVQSNAVDFGDLLLYNHELLAHEPEILELYQRKFKYILIDEYQDTNTVQYSWAKMLAGLHQNLCCVGDDDQSIYSWRGAEVGNILRFEKDFANARVIRLEQNYRSSPSILAAASGVISHNKQRHGKQLWTERDKGDLVRIVSCWNDKEEARFVVSEIESAISAGTPPQEIAILVRAGFQTRPFEESLIANAVPYKIIGGLKFYDRMEIRDALAYIRVSLNSGDDLALERIINVPRRGIGDTTIKSIKAHGQANNLSMFASIGKMVQAGVFKGKIGEALNQLTLQFEAWNHRYTNEPPADVTKAMLEDSGYLPVLKEEKTEESRGRIENLNEMLRAIADFENIGAFIEHTSLVMDHDITSDAGGAVSLMTLHASKGLEFEVVFLPGWEEGVFPHQKSIAEEGAKGLEEERRIAYVGITRAKKQLCISYAESRRIFHEFVSSIPSRFIAEIPPEVCIRSTSKSGGYQPRYQERFKNYTPAASTATKAAPKDPFAPGTRVRHASFGTGIVIRKSDDALEIAFDRLGVKTIKKDFVKAG